MKIMKTILITRRKPQHHNNETAQNYRNRQRHHPCRYRNTLFRQHMVSTVPIRRVLEQRRTRTMDRHPVYQLQNQSKMKIFFNYPIFGDGGQICAYGQNIIAGSERQICVTREEAINAGFTEEELENLPEKAVRAGKERARKLRASASQNVWI